MAGVSRCSVARRIGLAADDPEGQSRLAAFLKLTLGSRVAADVRIMEGCGHADAERVFDQFSPVPPLSCASPWAPPRDGTVAPVVASRGLHWSRARVDVSAQARI